MENISVGLTISAGEDFKSIICQNTGFHVEMVFLFFSDSERSQQDTSVKREVEMVTTEIVFRET